MNKRALKQIRNKKIKEFWEENKSELSMEEIGYIFGLEIAQIYRIIKKVETKNNKK